MKNKTANTSRTSKSRTATSIPANGASASTPPDFVLEGELAERCAALAKQHGVTPEAIVQKAVQSLLGKAENGAVAGLTPEQKSAMAKFKIDGDALVRREYDDAVTKIAALAETMRDLPATPNLDLLTQAQSICLDAALKSKGIRLATPGLLGDIEIPVQTALDAMACTLMNLDRELMRLAVSKHPELKKEIADTLLLAEALFARWDGGGVGVVCGKGEESDRQLFARWASTGTDFEEFERILEERDNRWRVRASIERARKVDLSPAGSTVAD